MTEYFWELVQRDGTITLIPPAGVELVKKRMANKDPINTRTETIPYAQIDHFRVTDKPFSSQTLLEAAARAFNDPQITEGGIKARWVKKTVTAANYAKHYSNIPAYRKLADEGPMVVIAFRLPVHSIDPESMSYCTEDEIDKLGR